MSGRAGAGVGVGARGDQCCVVLSRVQFTVMGCSLLKMKLPVLGNVLFTLFTVQCLWRQTSSRQERVLLLYMCL